MPVSAWYTARAGRTASSQAWLLEVLDPWWATFSTVVARGIPVASTLLSEGVSMSPVNRNETRPKTVRNTTESRL